MTPLQDRLRAHCVLAPINQQTANLLREAADRIDALEAEIASEEAQYQRFKARRDAEAWESSPWRAIPVESDSRTCESLDGLLGPVAQADRGQG